jgi:hypothetical protein
LFLNGHEQHIPLEFEVRTAVEIAADAVARLYRDRPVSARLVARELGIGVDAAAQRLTAAKEAGLVRCRRPWGYVPLPEGTPKRRRAGGRSGVPT